MDKVKTGQLIREARKEKNYTQSELGDLVGVTGKAVSRWEKGEAFPDVGVLETLSEVLGLKIRDLVTGEVSEEEEDRERDLTELVRLTRIQVREKRRQIGKSVLLAAIFPVDLAACLLVMGGEDTLLGIAGIGGCILLWILTLGVMVWLAHRRGSDRSGIWWLDLGTWIWPIVSLAWTILLFGLACVSLQGGRKLFGLEPSAQGPFLMWNLRVVFLGNLILLAAGVTLWIRDRMGVRPGQVLALTDAFLCALLGNLLHRMTSFDGFVAGLVRDLLILLAGTGMALLLYLLMNLRIRPS